MYKKKNCWTTCLVHTCRGILRVLVSDTCQNTPGILECPCFLAWISPHTTPPGNKRLTFYQSCMVTLDKVNPMHNSIFYICPSPCISNRIIEDRSCTEQRVRERLNWRETKPDQLHPTIGIRLEFCYERRYTKELDRRESEPQLQLTPSSCPPEQSVSEKDYHFHQPHPPLIPQFSCYEVNPNPKDMRNPNPDIKSINVSKHQPNPTTPNDDQISWNILSNPVYNFLEMNGFERNWNKSKVKTLEQFTPPPPSKLQTKSNENYLDQKHKRRVFSSWTRETLILRY